MQVNVPYHSVSVHNFNPETSFYAMPTMNAKVPNFPDYVASYYYPAGRIAVVEGLPRVPR